MTPRAPRPARPWRRRLLEKFRTIVEDSRKRPPTSTSTRSGTACEPPTGASRTRRPSSSANWPSSSVQVIFVLTQAPMRNEKLTSKVTQLTELIEARGLPIADGRVHPVMALADDELDLPAHGLDTLLDATFQVVPLAARDGVNAAQQIDMARKRRHARKAVVAAASLAGVTGATPIPFANAAALVPIQAAMMAKVAAGFGLWPAEGQHRLAGRGRDPLRPGDVRRQDGRHQPAEVRARRQRGGDDHPRGRGELADDGDRHGVDRGLRPARQARPGRGGEDPRRRSSR